MTSYRSEMIYEMRTYRIVPGKMAQIEARFRDHTFALFRRHGISVAGFWRKRDADELVYVCQFADAEAMCTAWAEFRDDADWQSVKAASEADGPLVAEVGSEMMAASVWQAP